jgi:hypothetical protein
LYCLGVPEKYFIEKQREAKKKVGLNSIKEQIKT